MTVVFIFSALTLDWLLCELLPIEETFWLDDLIQDQDQDQDSE